MSPITCWDCKPFIRLPAMLPGRYRIFPGIFEVASVAWLAGKINAAADRHVEALVAQFSADHGSEASSRLHIPGRGRCQGRRQQRRRSGFASAAIRMPTAESARLTSGIPRRSMPGTKPAQISSAAAPITSPQHSPARAVNKLDLFVQRHLLHYHVGTLVRETASDRSTEVNWTSMSPAFVERPAGTRRAKPQ